MANVLNRLTRAYIASANTVDYPEQDWIINPDLSAVVGFDAKYWIVTGDAVSLMSEAQRNAVDAAEISAARDAIAASLDELEGELRAFALTVLDEINLHAQRVTAILDAVDGAGSYGAMRTAIAGIADVPTRTIAQLKTAMRNKLGT